MRYLCANENGDPTAVALDSVAGQTFEADPEGLTWAIRNADESVHRAGKLVPVDPVQENLAACSERTQLEGTELWGPCIEPVGHEGPHRTVRALT